MERADYRSRRVFMDLDTAAENALIACLASVFQVVTARPGIRLTATPLVCRSGTKYLHGEAR